MEPKGTELAEALRRIRDADQRAEYHARRALEWTVRAHRWREEIRGRLAADKVGKEPTREHQTN